MLNMVIYKIRRQFEKSFKILKKGFSRNETYKTTDEGNSDIEQSVQTGIREVPCANKC